MNTTNTPDRTSIELLTDCEPPVVKVYDTYWEIDDAQEMAKEVLSIIEGMNDEH